MTILYFIIALGILIFVHELGHFILAKRAGIFVEAFSLGFGPRLFGVKYGETDYRVSLLPLGGYVKMRGEEPDEETANDPRSFSSKSVWSRFKVVLWGPLMNLIFCLAIMPIVFMIGRSEPVFFKEKPVLMGVRAESPAARAGLEKGDEISSIDGTKVGNWEELMSQVLLNEGKTLKIGVVRNGASSERDITIGQMPEIKGGYAGFEPLLFMANEAMIDGLKPGGPAEVAGVKPGDKVVSLGGDKIVDWLELSMKVDTNGGKEADMVVLRDGKEVTLKVTPVYDKEFGRWLIGISKDRKSGVPMIVRKYGFTDAVVAGTKENIKLAELTFEVLKRLVTGKLSMKVLGGPIIIAKTSAAAAASGLADFLYFMAFLSLQLSILNILPIPVLDGGHLVYFAIEAVRKKPLSIKIRSIADQVGFVLLISLMVYVTYNDINNIWGIGDLLKKIF